MAEVTINNVVKESKTPAVIGSGVLLGFMLQKVVNRAIGSDTVSGLLGETTTKNFKKYLSPAIVTGIGVAVNLSSKDQIVKNLSAGVAISGTVNIGMQAIWGKNPLSGLDGFLGAILGDDDPDLADDLGDNDDEDDLGDNDDEDDLLKGLGNDDDPEGDLGLKALPSGDINLNVEQSENNQMEGSFGDLIPSKAPGVRDQFVEPIFGNIGEDVNLL